MSLGQNSIFGRALNTSETGTVDIHDENRISKKSVFHEAALLYAEKYNFSVFPCVPKEKYPLTDHGCKDASKNIDTINDFWTRWQDANVAIACGARSGGLLVLDIDGEQGQDSLKGLETKYGSLPLTPHSLTGNGQQLFLHTKARVKNRVGVAPGIDIRTDGGYVIAPPSIHPNGRRYAWEVSARIDEVKIAVAPDWLIQLITSEAQSSPSGKQDWSQIATMTTQTGSRNANLAKLAGHLLRRYVDPKIVYRLLWAWNQCCTDRPLPTGEFDRTIESIAGRELARREGRRI